MLDGRAKDFEQIVAELQHSGYSIVNFGKSLGQRLLDIASRIYALPLRDRLTAIANVDSGVLGYYPSEVEGRKAREHIDVVFFDGGRSRGYSSFDCLPNNDLVGCSPVLLGNKWPSNCDEIDRQIALLYAEVCDWSIEFCRGFLDEIQCDDLEDVKRALASGKCCSLMRFLKYAADGKSQVSKAHTDYELLTFLVATGDGLEVKGPDGSWRLVHTESGQAVILPGDMCQLLSRGRIRSSLHRVSFGLSQRLSAVFFQGLPLDFELADLRGKDEWPQTFGEHLLGLLARGSPHLSARIDEISKHHNFRIPAENPFKFQK